jgi:DNA-binding transcriptional MocR family regulator
MSAAESLSALKALHSSAATTLFSGVTPPGLVNLGIGAPSDDCRPLNPLKEAWEGTWGENGLAMASKPEDFLQYGPQLGHSAVIEAMAQWLTKEYNAVYKRQPAASNRPDFVPVEKEKLAITAGASQSLFNIASLFLRKDSVVLMEDPTYFLAWASLGELLGGFEAFGVRQRPGSGLHVEELERTLKGLSGRDGAIKYDQATFDPSKVGSTTLRRVRTPF